MILEEIRSLYTAENASEIENYLQVVICIALFWLL